MDASATLIDRLDRSTAEVFVGMTDRTPGGRVIRQDGLLLVIGADTSPIVVNTILTEGDHVEPGALAAAVEVFRQVGHVPSLMSRDHRDADLHDALPGLGWTPLLALPGMVLEERPPRESPPTGVTIHAVRTDEDRQRWIEGNLEGFAEDDGERSALRSAFQTVDSLTGALIRADWAEADGRGVASSMGELVPETDMAIVGWVGTDRAYRRRGIGRAVTLANIHELYDLGAGIVGLQASPMGFPVYAKLGFRTICQYRIWLPPDGRTPEG